jgi:hypothetical protein
MSRQVFDSEELEDLEEEAVDILKTYNLDPLDPTERDIEALWEDFYTEPDDTITHIAVARARKDVTLDLRRLDWLWRWYGFWAEEIDLSNNHPSHMDYAVFFTIRGPLEFAHSGTSMYECLRYLRVLDQSKERRNGVQNHT